MVRLRILLFVFILVSALMQGCKDNDPKPYKPEISLEIMHYWNDSALVLNSTYIWEQDFKTDTIRPTTLIYHINHLKLMTTDSLIIDADEPWYMVDYNEKKTLPAPIHFKAPREGIKYYINRIEFTIGVQDSVTNQKGLLNSIFLSPMYWGMIQGYINFKFEAVSPKPGAIIYHIGGYLEPYKNFRRIQITFNKPYLLERTNELTLKADLFKLFKSTHEIDIDKINLIHSPNADSKLIADNMARLFTFNSLITRE